MCIVHSTRAMHVNYAPHHQMQCIIELRTFNSIGVPNLVSLAQNFLEPEDPLSNKVFRSWRAQPAPHKNGNQLKHTEWGSIRVTCKFGAGGALRLACRGGKRTKGTKHLHVHCTCTLYSSPFNRTASSTPCQGLPTYRVWCL